MNKINFLSALLLCGLLIGCAQQVNPDSYTIKETKVDNNPCYNFSFESNITKKSIEKYIKDFVKDIPYSKFTISIEYQDEFGVIFYRNGEISSIHGTFYE